MPRRTLALAKETLRDLTPGDLAGVAGGAPPTWDCHTVGLTCTLGYSWRFCVAYTWEPHCLTDRC